MGVERERTRGFRKLQDGLRQADDWYLWGPYVSERQWGTVREDYSADGEAWAYLPHDHARSRAYRWGEDGLAGFCDIEQRLCLGLALWNGRPPGGLPHGAPGAELRISASGRVEGCPRVAARSGVARPRG